MITEGFVEIIREEQQALRSGIARLKTTLPVGQNDEIIQKTIDRLVRLDERLEMLLNRNLRPRIKPGDLKVMIRDIFGTETLEDEKYEILLRWIVENL